MTYIKAFEAIKEKLKNVDTGKFTRDFAIQINLINKDCAGAFYIAYLQGVFSVEPYDYRDHSAMLTLMLGDFNKIVEGKLTLEKAVESGKTELSGEMGAAKELFAVAPIAEAPKKKTAKAEKKTLPKRNANPQKLQKSRKRRR